MIQRLRLSCWPPAAHWLAVAAVSIWLLFTAGSAEAGTKVKGKFALLAANESIVERGSIEKTQDTAEFEIVFPSGKLFDLTESEPDEPDEGEGEEEEEEEENRFAGSYKRKDDGKKVVFKFDAASKALLREQIRDFLREHLFGEDGGEEVDLQIKTRTLSVTGKVKGGASTLKLKVRSEVKVRSPPEHAGRKYVYKLTSLPSLLITLLPE